MTREQETKSGRQQWEDFKAEILERIKAIDNATTADEGTPHEPDWWCHMMDVARLVRDPNLRFAGARQ